MASGFKMNLSRHEVGMVISAILDHRNGTSRSLQCPMALRPLYDELLARCEDFLEVDEHGPTGRIAHRTIA